MSRGICMHVYLCVRVQGHRYTRVCRSQRSSSGVVLKGCSFVSLGQSLAETWESQVRWGRLAWSLRHLSACLPAQGHLTSAAMMPGFPKNVLEMKLRSSSSSARAHQLSCCPVPPNPQSLPSVQCQFSGQEIEACRLILEPPGAVTKFSNNGFSPSPYPPQSAWLTVREKERGTPVKEEYEQPGITQSPLRSSHPAFISTGCLSLTSMTVFCPSPDCQTGNRKHRS